MLIVVYAKGFVRVLLHDAADLGPNYQRAPCCLRVCAEQACLMVLAVLVIHCDDPCD